MVILHESLILWLNFRPLAKPTSYTVVILIQHVTAQIFIILCFNTESVTTEDAGDT